MASLSFKIFEPLNDAFFGISLDQFFKDVVENAHIRDSDPTSDPEKILTSDSDSDMDTTFLRTSDTALDMVTWTWTKS